MNQSINDRAVTDKSYLTRSSNIELLKVLTIFVIIMGHWDMTLATVWKESMTNAAGTSEALAIGPSAESFMSGLLKYGYATNYIFFVCSAWFLIDSKKTYGKKICAMLTDVWFVSVIILIIVAVFGKIELEGSVILRCLFPTTFSNNWYITQYAIFLFIVPYLNAAISALSKKKHLAAVLFLLTAKSLLNAFLEEWGGVPLGGMFFGEWVCLYLAIAYIKNYIPDFSKSIPGIVIPVVIALRKLIYPAIIGIFNINADYSSIPSILTRSWENGYGMFEHCLIAIAVFNLFRNFNFRSKLINRISKQSLLIYIIHENLLILLFYRPMICRFVLNKFGAENTIMILFALTILTYIVSLLLSFIYEKAMSGISKKVSDHIYQAIMKFGNKAADAIGKLH